MLFRTLNALAVALALIIPFHVPPSEAETITLASGTWGLLTGKDLPEKGIISRLIRDAYATVDMKMARIEQPWKRILYNIENGSVDGGYPFGKTKERESKFLFTSAIGSANRYVYHHKERPFQWQSVEDLKGLRIGIVRGAVFGKYHEALLERIAVDPYFAKIEDVTEDVQNLRKLLKGRIDIFFGEENQTNMLAHQLSQTEPNFRPEMIVAVPKMLMDNSPLYLIFKKGERGARLRDLFNEGLRRLHQDMSVD